MPVPAHYLQRTPDLDALILAFNGFIYICSQDYRIQYMNDKLRERTGYDATGEYCYKVLHDCDEVCSWCNNDKLFREQKTIRWQLKSPKDERWYDIINTPIHNTDGTVSSQFLIMDITDCKNQAQVLIEERNKLESLFATLTDGITVQDTDFKVLYQNKAHRDKQGSHTGEYCYQAYQNRTTICDGCLLVKSFADGKVHRRETVTAGKNGTIYWEVTSSPMKDAEGKIIAGIENVRDITAQKNLEERLAQSHKIEAMGTLAGGIAHDFNNMLAPIIGYSELALTKLAPNDRLTTDLQIITKVAGRAKELVQQLLTFSRRAPHEKKLFQPQVVAIEALKFLRAALPSTIEIRTDIPSECGTIFADPTQFYQIIINFCTNAYHAMQVTGGVLEVVLAEITMNDDSKTPNSELAPGDYILLKIHDTGCGIEEEMLPHIFDPDFTSNGNGEDTDLGLFVAHNIVKNYQGHVSVQSEPGKGTDFHIYLPKTTKIASLSEAACNEKTPTGTERLLVVDDDEIVATMLQQILQSLGYKVTLSFNSLKALALIDQTPLAFDLLLTDMTMPDLTGLELAQKTQAIRADLPIVLCTGANDRVNKEQAQALGIQTYLMKPVSILDLGLAVRKALDTKKEFL